jgi:hypothetical protein
MDDFEILLCEAQQLVSSIACNAEGLRTDVRAAAYSNKFEYPAGFQNRPLLLHPSVLLCVLLPFLKTRIFFYIRPESEWTPYIRPESEWTPYIIIIQHCLQC